MPGHRRRGGTLVASQQRQPGDHAPPVALRARAAAKVNLGLYVGPVRADGRYHEVVSVLQSIAIWDELEVEVVPEGLWLEVEGGGLPPDETNLVLMAARELARRSRDLPGARFRLRKGIPPSTGSGACTCPRSTSTPWLPRSARTCPSASPAGPGWPPAAATRSARSRARAAPGGSWASTTSGWPPRTSTPTSTSSAWPPPWRAAGPTTCWPPWPPATPSGWPPPCTTTSSRPPSTCSRPWPSPSSGSPRQAPWPPS